MTNGQEIAAIFSRFAAGCTFSRAEAHPGGLINRSWLITGQARARYFLQEINTGVFSRPELMMGNVVQVTAHLAAKGERTLEFLPVLAEPSGFLLRRGDGTVWRMCRYIEGTRTVARISGPADAENAGRAYGRFLKGLVDFPADRLQATLPGFHDTPARWSRLLQVFGEDVHGRSAAAQAEMAGLRNRQDLARGLADLDLPLRVVHNDAKLANVLLDAVTGEAVCVVDLDTVMPGTVLYDFGDMMRTMCYRAGEEERDLGRVAVDPDLLAALARGYLAETEEVLSPIERANLFLSGLVITFEQAVRFLTDHLQGDVYYHTIRPDQNLDRCRNQLALLESRLVASEGWT